MGTKIKCDNCGDAYSEKDWDGITHYLVTKGNDLVVIEKDLCQDCQLKMIHKLLKVIQRFFELEDTITKWDVSKTIPDFKL